MNKLLVVLDHQHAGKPGHRSDRGTIGADGVEEASLVRQYFDSADRELRRLGHEVIPMADGEYADRWKRANIYGAGVYLAGHVNAGGGSYGLVAHDARSTRGPLLAAHVRAALVGHAGATDVRVVAARPDDDGQSRDEDFTEALNCIAGVWAPALVLEPFFIDGPAAHVAWARQSIQLIGQAIARGVQAWTEDSRA